MCDLLDVVVQEVAIKYCHIGNLTELNATHAMLLVPLTGHIDSHGTQRLLAGDGLLDITRLAYPAQHVLWSRARFCRINAEFDIHHRRDGIVGMEYHVGTCIIERLDGIGLIGQFLTDVGDFLFVRTSGNLRSPQRCNSGYGACCAHTADILIGDEVQVGQHVTLVKVSGNLLCILNTAQHEMGSTTAL